MIIDKFFDFISKYHHNRIANYCKDLDFINLIDIGAHKGEFLGSFIKKKKIKNIYCFEPQKKIFDLLKKDFLKFRNIKFFNFALGNVLGKKRIFQSKLTSTATLSTFNKNSNYLKFKNFLLKNNKLGENIKVNQKTFDKVFLKNSLKKTFLKIDVEGYELQVLLGAKKKIRNIDFILIEQQFFDQYKNNFYQVKKFLLNNGFYEEKSFCFPTFHYRDILFINKRNT